MIIRNEILKKFKNKKGGINTKKIRMQENSFYLEELIKLTNFLPENIHLRFRYNFLKEDQLTPKFCKTCNKILTDVKGSYCSGSCSVRNIETIEKIRIKKNNKSDLENKKIKEKTQRTNLEKYGCLSPSQNIDVKEKLKRTNLEKYGVESVFQVPEILEKAKNSTTLKYGGTGFGSSIIFDKIKRTNLEKYGVEFFSKTNDWYKKCINTCLAKYGKEWVSKVDHINKKQQSGGYSYYNFTFPSGKVCRTQGYENLVLVDLLSKYSEDDIVIGTQNIIDNIGFFKYVYQNKERRYYPDIYIKSEKLVIEVKSKYFYNKEKNKNILKRESVLKEKLNFKFIII